MTADANDPESEGDPVPASDGREQNRVNETICLKLNDLEYRVDDLELWKTSRETNLELRRMETPSWVPVPDRSGDNKRNRSGSNQGNCSESNQGNRSGSNEEGGDEHI